MTPLFRLFLVVLVVLCAVVACGGGEDEDGHKNRLPLNCDQEDCTK